MLRRFRKVLRKHFGFSRAEFNGILVLCGILILFVSGFEIYKQLELRNYDVDHVKADKLDSLLALVDIKNDQQSVQKHDEPIGIPFGNSNQPERKKSKKEKASQKIEKMPLNKADTSHLKKIYGIGNVLSERIIKYRDLLGGFVSLNQIAEVYGIKPEVAAKFNQYFYIDEPIITKINLNEVKFKSLLRHPYFDYETTKKVFNAKRKQALDSAALRHIFISDSAFQKISPYIKW